MKASLLKFFIPAIALFASGNAAIAKTYFIDPASSLTLSGNLSIEISFAIPGSPVVTGSGILAEQGAGSGSLRSTLSGFVNANAAGGVLSFPGGSSITALPSGNWDPTHLPAAFGFELSVPLSTPSIPDVGTIRLFGDIRDLTFDVSGNVALNGNSFDPLGLSLISKSGTVDVHGLFCEAGVTDLTKCNDFGTTSSPADDGAGPDLLPSGTGSFAGNNLSLGLAIADPESQTDQQTITIGGVPVQVTSKLTGTLNVAGTVFAAAVPEPAAWLALCVGLLAFAMIARKAKA
jgi:hypothetical protein